MDRASVDGPDPRADAGPHRRGLRGHSRRLSKCNLTCSPCYHSADANKVRTDGAHTIEHVKRQMTLLRERRGPRAHAQLIGGEVSLLSPDDHAASLLAMRAAGREPMSMTHGDFDQDYLRDLVTRADGGLRLPRVSFAAHFDSLMRGRRGVPQPRTERELDAHRAAFVSMFERVKRQTGLRYFLAHNMTVTRANLDQVADVVASVRHMGYSMMSFQPAARVGDPRRWDADEQSLSIDEVWEHIERGMGQSVAWQGRQFGDSRCNPSAFGVVVDNTWVPLLDPAVAADLAFRDAVFARVPGVSLSGERLWVMLAKALRVALCEPRLAVMALQWSQRFVRRSGGWWTLTSAGVRGQVAGTTYVVHAFMDASRVIPAWRTMQAGGTPTDDGMRVTVERLRACVCTMAQADTGELVPACVQHSVLDPQENRELLTMLPMPTRR